MGLLLDKHLFVHAFSGWDGADRAGVDPVRTRFACRGELGDEAGGRLVGAISAS
ncbi:hypothetical protein ACEWB4_18055 [Sphingobium sp. sgz301303]|uniref:hypothetical protein n=1 Tax=Sphingobium sp. sgz301304 TaxID=3341828 RepID=UPI0035A57E00